MVTVQPNLTILCLSLFLLGWAWASPTYTSLFWDLYLYNIYIYIICHAINHFWFLFCMFLHHSLIQKLFTNYSVRRHELSTSSMVTARTETIGGPTYSMARAILLLMPLFALPFSVEVTRHMDQPLQWPHQWACHKRQWECHVSVDTSYKAHSVLDPCACSNHTWHACWTT